MNNERELSDTLKSHGNSVDCPQHVHERIKMSYNNFLIKKEGDGFFMKKRIIASVITVTMLITAGVYASPKIGEIINRTTIKEKDISLELLELTSTHENLDLVQTNALEKVFKAFPETKSFILSSVTSGEGLVITEEMNWAMIHLTDPDDTNKNFIFTIDKTTGEFLDFSRNGHRIDFSSLTDPEIIETSKNFVESLCGNIDGYEYKMDSELEASGKYVQFENAGNDMYYKVYYSNESLQVSILLK